MTNRELRTRRRAAERKVARKEAKIDRKLNAAGTAAEAASVPPFTPEIGFVSQPAPRVQANRQNAQLSTGPTTPQGKLASSRNSLKHGLSSGQLIVPGEDPAEFAALRNAFLAEYQPATVTEQLLVQEIVASHWLAQRALRMQNDSFSANGVDEKRLSLFLRYQTTHQRAFHKALATLRALQKERRKQLGGFVSQTEESGFVSQTCPPQPAGADAFVSQNALELLRSEIRQEILRRDQEAAPKAA